MNSLTTKAQSLKFESKITWSTTRRSKQPRKAQEGHLEEGIPQKLTKGKKNGKAKRNGKKELGKAQSQHKCSKLTLPLKLTPTNTLNASSPP
jgi:hypothetical protein